MSGPGGPLQAFQFDLRIEGGPGGIGFLEVSGLESPDVAVPYAQAGANSLVRALPRPRSIGPLICKRGSADVGDPLLRWVRDTLEGRLAAAISPKTLHLFLMDETGRAVAAWELDGAWPVSWSVAGFSAASGNEVAIEELAFAFKTLSRT